MFGVLGLLLMCQSGKVDQVVLPFIKADSIGFNPLNPDERIIYKRSAVDKMTREFRKTPVVLVTQTDSRDGKKATVEYKKVGEVSCVFVGPDQWISGSVDLSAKLPKNFVMRARTVSGKNSFKDGILVVDEAEILEFQIKEEKTATRFK